MVGCHLSHLYEDGASMYFTFMSAIPLEQQMEKWREAKRAVHEVFARHGSAVSHQHGVGTMHSDIYREVHDDRILEAWRAARNSLVPVGHFNPGKLMDLPPRGTVSLNSVTEPSSLSVSADSDVEA
jgi:alkyldihydroxyacetonephosphate synthase